MLLRNAAYAGRRVVPPLLIEQEGLIHEIVWPSLPILADEPTIVRQWLDAAVCLAAFRRVAKSIVGEADGFSRGFVD